MSSPEALASFVAKWRARWPEWNIARAFVPAAQRDLVEAWFALLQELTDAAWGGHDPAPGLAKLAWWQEELGGWSRGARRHPLGDVLQRLPAPWAVLAASLLPLQRSREWPRDLQAAIGVLHPFAAAVIQCETALFGPCDDATALAGRMLLADRLLADPDGAVPLHVPAHEAASNGCARDWAVALLEDWPGPVAARPRRLHAALLHARLVDFASAGHGKALPPWQTLAIAWRAARKG